MDAYRTSLAQRLDPAAGFLQKLQGAVLKGPKKRIVFAEGEEPSVIRAASAFQAANLGTAVLVGREDLVHENMLAVGLDPADSKLEILNARLSDRNTEYVDYLYGRLQREGFLRDVHR
jgi:malate dehydrogenase (oxaloacetate-decarboxylating)(NADP+)